MRTFFMDQCLWDIEEKGYEEHPKDYEKKDGEEKKKDNE